MNILAYACTLPTFFNKLRDRQLILFLFIAHHCSDKDSGMLALICELMDMNIYEMIKGKGGFEQSACYY